MQDRAIGLVAITLLAATISYAEPAVEVDHLIARLRSTDRAEREEAARALGALGPIAKRAIPDLMGLFDDPDWHVRGEAIGAVSAMGPDAKVAIPRMIKALDDNDVAETASYGLASFGKDAVPAIICALETYPGPAADALAMIGEPAVAPVIGALAQPHLRVGAADAIRYLAKSRRVGPEKLSRAVPGLIRNITENDGRTRSATLMALQAMGPEVRAAVPVLTATLSDSDVGLRVGAINALESIGPDARSAIPALTLALQDNDYQVRQNAAAALKKIQGATSMPASK